MEEIKLTQVLHHWKDRNSLAPHYQKALLQWEWHLILVKVAPVDLCPSAAQVLNKEFIAMYSEDQQAGSGRDVVLSECGVLGEEAPRG